MSKPTLVPYERLASRPQHRQARERALASIRESVAAQARSLARLTGRDLRCLMECGLRWGRVDDTAGVTWQVQAGKWDDYPECNEAGWAHFGTLPEMASAVRKWQAAQAKPEPAPEITQEAERIHLRPLTWEAPPLRCHEVTVTNKPEPEPSPEDAATARIEAAGASIDEGHAVRVDGEDGQSMTISGVPTPTGLAELAAFAEAHRVTQTGGTE